MVKHTTTTPTMYSLTSVVTPMIWVNWLISIYYVMFIHLLTALSRHMARLVAVTASLLLVDMHSTHCSIIDWHLALPGGGVLSAAQPEQL